MVLGDDSFPCWGKRPIFAVLVSFREEFPLHRIFALPIKDLNILLREPHRSFIKKPAKSQIMKKVGKFHTDTVRHLRKMWNTFVDVDVGFWANYYDSKNLNGLVWAFRWIPLQSPPVSRS